MSDPALLMSDLDVRAGGRRILRVDHLRIDPGEVVALIGPNGAGKSTLLRTSLGFQKPAAGEVKLLGRPLGRLGPLGLARLRREVAYLPQLHETYAHMPLTLREVVAIGRTGRRGLLRSPTAEDRDAIGHWLDRLELLPLADRRFVDCSGGQQRKALIALAMVQQPRMLMLDEPTAWLDLRWRERIVASLDQIAEEVGVTIVLVCHEIEVVPAACRRVVVLIDGAVDADGPPERVLRGPRIDQLYGPGLTVRHGRRHALVPSDAEAP
jgi:ABC-type cobalamin/Fe3+-siderophores transport system ATPase subunit